MATMNVSLPDPLKQFVEEQVSERGYGTSSEFVRELIRREQARQQLRACLLYTSDASDERSSVDLGGRRIFKTKKKNTKQCKQ